jgi:hypothetical protein
MMADAFSFSPFFGAPRRSATAGASDAAALPRTPPPRRVYAEVVLRRVRAGAAQAARVPLFSLGKHRGGGKNETRAVCAGTHATRARAPALR